MEQVEVTEPLVLERFAVKPGHVPGFEALWRDLVDMATEHGITSHRAFLETDAEPKFSWLWSAPDPTIATASLTSDPRHGELRTALAPHVFRNRVVRRVDPWLMTHASAESVQGDAVPQRIAIMRRYHLVDPNGGDDPWPAFEQLWRRIVPVRESHGFRCLFAVADRPHDLFTWAFDFDGDFADFPAAQRGYYHDPSRVELRTVFDFMADYSIHPARQLLW